MIVLCLHRIGDTGRRKGAHMQIGTDRPAPMRCVPIEWTSNFSRFQQHHISVNSKIWCILFFYTSENHKHHGYVEIESTKPDFRVCLCMHVSHASRCSVTALWKSVVETLDSSSTLWISFAPSSAYSTWWLHFVVAIMKGIIILLLILFYRKKFDWSEECVMARQS